MTHHPEKYHALVGLLSRPDGGTVSLADQEALWNLLQTLASEGGLQFTGRIIPVDIDNLTPEKVKALFLPESLPNDPL
ncbi:hypothetical protein [Deinococcus sonorensis]|uniref:Uncharacterized protein n=1 Tax=Deinococcus sonorensis TaxID=309891 RepID=A0ABV8YA98_9DEIO